MRILLDARKLGDGGIGTYIETLVDGLLELQAAGSASIELTLFIAPGAKSRAQPPARWASAVKFIEEGSPKYSLAEYFLLPLKHRATLKAHDIFHSPHYTLPYFIPVSTVVTIHDAIHVSHPQTILHRPLGKLLIGSALRRATRVITVSKVSAAVLSRIAGRRLKSPISVVPNAVRREFTDKQDSTVESQFLARHSLMPGYCLFVGNPKPHKGWDTLLAAWSIVQKSLGDAAPQLVVVGYGFDAVLRQNSEQLFGNSKLRFLHDLTVPEQGVVYRQAKLLLFPSRAEGFGLPVLEAMASNLKVVATPLDVVREVADKTISYANGDGGAAFAEAVLSSLSGEDRLQTEAAKERSRQFTVRTLAEETYRVYESCLCP